MTTDTYFVLLELDEKWFKALDTFTADVHEGEVCSWLSVDINSKEQ